MWHVNRNILFIFGVSLLLLNTYCLGDPPNNEDDEDAFVESEEFDTATDESPSKADVVIPEDDDTIVYATPKTPPSAYLAETFDDLLAFEKKWIKSQAKKDGVDADIAKYDGVWSVEESITPILKGDRGLVLKSKAKHAAIAAPLSRPFKFGAKPLVVQYEATLQDGQECGGAYLKLLSVVEGKPADLKNFQDRTAYTIMFGPDKCGNDYKLHFIFRHVNPLSGSIEEKHAKRPSDKLEEPFKDKRPHLYTLILNPDNTFDISVDHSIINSGHLLEDFTPPVNPEKEIADPDDFKPADWDEREKIPDPDDTKPEDWDDDAPKKIPDESATIPSGWLEDEPEMIPNPEAVRPDDWDNDMDGEWEAPLVDNPACADAPGCGPWARPMIDNPNYKGKWRPRLINNPNYRGQWTPRMIPNPHYFEDLEPFKMTPISAVGFELWSMSENILFDNIIVTDSINEARQFAADTFDLKVTKLDKGKGNLLQQFLEYSNQRPWIYAVYVLVSAIPVVLIVMCCCSSSQEKTESAASKKKTDAPTADDPPESEAVASEEGEDEEDEEEEEEQGDEASDEGKGSQEEAGEEEGDTEEKEDEDARPSPRLRRKPRKD